MRAVLTASTLRTTGIAVAVTLSIAAAAIAQPKPAAAPKPEPAATQGTVAKPAPATAAQERPVPPEMKALRDASAITDADKQIEAFKKIITDYPGTGAADSAANMIVSALVRKTTADVKALQEQVKSFVDGAKTANEKAQRMRTSASSLADAGLLLDEAEQYATKALELVANEKAWVEAEKKAAAAAQADATKKDPAAKLRPAVPDAEYATRYLGARQGMQFALAQVYDRQHRAADAEKAFRAAYALDPKSPTAGTAALKIADFAKKAGHPFEQLEYLTAATLVGKVTAESRKELEALFASTTGGTVAQLDALLDERYEKTVTSIAVKPSSPAKTRTGRLVVAELFTGAGCPPCVAADLAFEAALQRYARRDFALLVYHLHVPRPDPMTNPSTEARRNGYDVPGTPTFFVDGGSQHVGGGSASTAQTFFEESIVPVVDKRLETRPNAVVKLTAAIQNGTVTVKAGATAEGKPDRALRLQIALVEDELHYTGENGVRIHPMVVRSLASPVKETQGFAFTAGKALKAEYRFDVAAVSAAAGKHLDDMEGGASKRFGTFRFIERRSAINPSQLRVVAFVQDEATKEILQAAMVELGVADRKPKGR
jgi:tetratricopeptide (TPR) repeat protein